MKATYIIKNNDGGFRMSRKVQGKYEKDVLGKHKNHDNPELLKGDEK